MVRIKLIRTVKKKTYLILSPVDGLMHSIRSKPFVVAVNVKLKQITTYVRIQQGIRVIVLIHVAIINYQ